MRESNHRLAFILLVAGIAATAIFGSWTWYNGHNNVVEEARQTAGNLLSRSAQMFMVSTRRFYDEFSAANTAAEKNEIHKNCIRTIFAVDMAITFDFGDENPVSG